VDGDAEFVAVLRELLRDFDAHALLDVGLPGETKETIQETIAFAKRINPHTIQVSLAAPYPFDAHALLDVVQDLLVAGLVADEQQAQAVVLENLQGHGTFIVGLPGETKETIQETIAFAKRINPHTIQVSLAVLMLFRICWLPDS
jgi:tRNA A37 methylthiotransferase MiaB